MKTTKIVALILVLVMLFCSCGNKEFSFSDGVDKNGYFEGITASDYFEMIDLSKIELNQSDMDEMLSNLTDKVYPIFNEVKSGVVKQGSLFNIDYVGKLDGKEFEGGNSNGQGSKCILSETSTYSGFASCSNFIDGFLEQIENHYVGETFDINVKFPETYDNEDLAGKDAVFTITVNNLYETSPATLNDEFVKTNLSENLGVSTVDELKDYFAQNLMREYLIDKNKLKKELPESLVEWTKNCAVKVNELYAGNYGVSVEIYLQYIYGVKDQEEFLKNYGEELKSEAQDFLLYQAIAEKEGIKASAAEFKKVLEDNASSGQYDNYVSTFGLNYNILTVLQDKITEMLMERVVFK